MNDFILTQPARALRYERGSEQALFEMVCSSGRRASFTNAMGDLYIYNDGPELHIELGQWVVLVAGETILLPPDRFDAAFTPA